MGPDQTMGDPPPLFCFALKEEAKFFVQGSSHVVFTGIGPANAERWLKEVLKREIYSVVLTCGFAGALNPALPVGAVLFEADEASSLNAPLLAAGACQARFHFSDRIAVTAAEKKALRECSGADAVEMESQVIRSLCKELKIPSATVRVISDAADENLPLDFNALMSADQKLNYGRLLLNVLGSPRKIPALLRLQRQTKLAARNLGEVLVKIIPCRA
jgi:nucleoside phosphorylase